MKSRSSYSTNEIRYIDIFNTILLLHSPKRIVEFGILDGFSLDIWKMNTECSIKAYDIFSDFNGNHAPKSIIECYREYPNVKIEYGNFYEKHLDIPDKSIDLLHIDIANTGDIYRYTEEYYFKKIAPHGVILLEGGSVERDKVSWMSLYNKTSIHDVVVEWVKKGYKVINVGTMPSLTIIRF